MRFQVLLSLWSVTGWLCIDKIPEVAKTKVSKPKRYSLSKLRLCHAPLKRLIQTRPHMSTSWCGNICLMPPKYSRKERSRGYSNRSSVDAAVSGSSCVFLCKSKSTSFGLLKVPYWPEYKTTLIIRRHPFFQMYLLEKGFLKTKSFFYFYFILKLFSYCIFFLF